MFGKISYVLSTRAWFLLVKVLAPFNKRAGLLNAGQKSVLKQFADFKKTHFKKSIWFHVSSLGEFEQGRPVMEALKKQFPDCSLVVTFFSPSGYEVKKNDPLCDAVFYLPFESRANAERVVASLNPMMAIWIKYDFWYEYLQALKNKQVPLYLCAAQFRKSQLFFKRGGDFQRKILRLFDFIFCQQEESKILLHSIGITNCMVSGDNRYDRVSQTLAHIEPLPVIHRFKESSFLLIAGSSYEVEEEIIEKVYQQLNRSFKIIIAPHFVDAARISAIEARFGQACIRYSACNADTVFEDKKIMIIDSIGMLAKVYQYGNAAFIGGGFWENGLHNILEAATFGMPVCFGPKVKRFPEAADLLQQGIATAIKDKNEFSAWLEKLLKDKAYCKEISEKSRRHIAANTGATKLVVDHIVASFKKH